MAPRFLHDHHGIRTALRSLVFLAILHRLNCLTFLVACAPVLLLTAFLLGVVLMESDMPPLEDVDRHLYKKIRRHNDHNIINSSDESLSSSSSDQEEDVMDLVVVEPKEEEEMLDLVVAEQEQEEEEEEEEDMEGKEAVVAWTADDERSIRSIGSLELERDARLEKLMSKRSSLQRNLIDLDVHIPARNLNLDIKGDPGSAPSSLMMLRSHNNPFFQDDHVQRAKEDQQFLTWHESFTVAPLNRPSRFRPYFVTATAHALNDGACIIDNSNSNSKKSSSSSSSSSSSAPSDPQKQPQTLPVKVEEECNNWDGNRIGMAVDVELISDSSDDDMSLPGGVSMTREHSSDDDEKNSFEVASITQQVAAAATLLAPPRPKESHHHQLQQQHEETSGPSLSEHQHELQQEDACVASMEKEKEVSEIREHPVPIVVDSSSSSLDAGASAASVGARAGAGAGTPGPSSKGNSSSKFKAPSKKAVFGFFKK